MKTRSIIALLGALCLAAPLAAQAIDFDQNIEVTPVLDAARRQSKEMKPVAASSIGNIWNVPETKNVTLAPGQTESAYIETDATIYQDVCENPFPPYTGPICRREVMTREPRRFKLVLAAPIPAAWGPQTFRITADMMRRPTLSVAALDKTHAWQYKIPEFYEDVLLVTPVVATQASFQAASLTFCTLKDIVKDQCVYTKPINPPNPDGTPVIACPQVLIPF